MVSSGCLTMTSERVLLLATLRYLKNVAYSMPDQDQYLVINTLFNAAKWINQLANQYPFAQRWGATDKSVPKQTSKDYVDSYEEIIYDDLWEDSDEMKKNTYRCG